MWVRTGLERSLRIDDGNRELLEGYVKYVQQSFVSAIKFLLIRTVFLPFRLLHNTIIKNKVGYLRNRK